MKTVLVVPDGVAIRNFLFSSFCRRLLAHGEMTVWHALPEASLAAHRQQLGPGVRWRPLPRPREPLAERVLRQAKLYAQLYWQRGRDGSGSMLHFLRPARHPVARLVQVAARLLGRLLGHRRGAILLDRGHEWAVRIRRGRLRPFRDTLIEERPDVVFCAHQRAGCAVPAMAAARALGVPTATFIYSWDNLPKGRMAVHADHYLVWSELMARQLRGYYPEVAAARVHVVGTPQFEPYFEPGLVRERAELLGALGLDPARPVICYSGCDVTSARYDPVYLGDLAAFLRTLPAASRPQILFRRSPADFSGRYRPVLERYPEIAVSDPAWLVAREGDWTQTVATREDVALLVNVVSHCALVVNVGSTMGMDFAVRDKPSVFIVYDPPGARPDYSVRHGYGLPHFELVKALRPVYWVERREDLGPAVCEALARPGVHAAARRRWLEAQVAHPLDAASARCVEALVAIAGG